MNEHMRNSKLEEYINEFLNKAKKQLGGDDIRVSTKFIKGSANSEQGDYAFYQNGEYHYLEAEKGIVMLKKATADIKEIAYWILDINIFRYAVDYASRNSSENKDDFRRVVFKKELEIHSVMDNDFYEKKKKSIVDILERAPFDNAN